jgi:hypothetical protein
MSLCVNNAIIDLFNFKKSQSLKKKKKDFRVFVQYYNWRPIFKSTLQCKSVCGFHNIQILFGWKKSYCWIQNNIFFLLQGWTFKALLLS